jgi:glycine dehydrogenase subunit 1
MAAIYLAAQGSHGLRQCAEHCYHKAHYVADSLAKISGHKLAFGTPFFHEFVLRLPVPASKVNRRLARENIIGGYDLGRDYPELPNTMLFCVTEKRTRAELDKLVEALNC